MAAATSVARTAGRAAVNVVTGAAQALPARGQGSTVLLVAGVIFVGYLFLSRRLEGVLRAGFGPLGAGPARQAPVTRDLGAESAGSSRVGELREEEERQRRSTGGSAGEMLRRTYERRGEPDTYRDREIKPQWTDPRGRTYPGGRLPRSGAGTPPIVPWEGGLYV